MIGELQAAWANAPRLRLRMVAWAVILASLTILALVSYKRLLGWEPWLIAAGIAFIVWGRDW